jgi:multiple sugar transport system substrate-binding protein
MSGRKFAAGLKIVLPALILLLAGIAGCGRRSGSGEALLFAVGGVPAELDVWERVASEFTASTGVAVELLRQPADSDQRRQGLAVALQSRQPRPDLFLMDVAWVAQFAASGWLSPLEASSGAADSLPGPEAFPAGAAAAGTYAGRRVALPVYVDGGLLYYRKDLLAKHGFSAPPATWEELVAMSRRVQAQERRTDPDFQGYVWQGAQYEGLVCNFLEVAASAGGGLPLRDGGIEVASAPNERALALMRGMLADSAISPPETYTGMKEEEARLHFQKGSALFERNWPYAWALHQQEGSPVRDRVGLAPLPHFPGHASASALGGWQVGVSAYSRRPSEARRFVAYLVSLPVQRRLVLELGWNAGRTALYADSAVLEKYPHFRALGGIFAQAVARPNLPYWTRLSDVLQRHLNAALSGKTTPAEALRAADAEAKAVAAEYRGR